MAIEVEHRGEVITYLEDTNKWMWHSGGAYDSLTLARKAIDRAIDGTTKFSRCSAICWEWHDRAIVEVTSITDDGEFWTKQSSGRRKVRSRELYADTPENHLKVAEWDRLAKQIEEMEAQQEKIKESMLSLRHWLEERDIAKQ
jgi:hypothetical protein